MNDSGPAHWQSRWQRSLGARRVVQDDFAHPDLLRWSRRIVETVRATPGEVVLVAHSFGCLAAVHAASALNARLRALMLVAPASPAKFGAQQAVDVIVPCASLLVASRNDPWLRFDDALRLARRWGSRIRDVGDAGHINVDSGHGEWDEGLDLLHRLVMRSRDRLPSLDATALGIPSFAPLTG